MREFIIKKNYKIITYFLGLYFLMIPFDAFQVFGDTSLLKYLSFFPIFLSLFYFKSKYFDLNNLRNKGILYLIFFTLLCAFQISYSQFANIVWSRFITIIMYLAFIILIAAIEFDEKEVNFLKKCFCYMSIMAAFLLLFFRFFFEGRITISFFGSMEDPNQYCGYLLPGIIYFLDNALSRRGIRLINFTMLLVLIYISFLTGSRGGILAIGLSCVTLCFLNNKKHKKIINILTLLSLSFAGYFFITKFLDLDLLNRFTVNDVVDTGGTGRLKIWQYYFNLFRNSNLFYCLFGYGIGGLNYIYRVAHNTWIELLIGNGIVGFISFALFFLKSLKNSIKIKDTVLVSLFVSMFALTLSLSLLSYKSIWALIILNNIALNNRGDSIEKNVNMF